MWRDVIESVLRRVVGKAYSCTAVFLLFRYVLIKMEKSGLFTLEKKHVFRALRPFHKYHNG